MTLTFVRPLRLTNPVSRPDVSRLVRLSLDHISEDTSVLLDMATRGVTHPPMNVFEMGARAYLLHVPGQSTAVDTAANMPDDLKRLRAYARKLGCVWVILDPDAPLSPALPTG